MAVPATNLPRRAWLPPLAVGIAGLVGCVVVGLSGPDAHVLPPCPFRSMTGWDCPGCGMTRGTRQLARANIGGAADFNVLLLVFVPFVAYLYLAWLAEGFGVRLPRPAVGRRSGIALCALLGGFAVLRNLPLGVGRWLNSGS